MKKLSLVLVISIVVLALIPFTVTAELNTKKQVLIYGPWLSTEDKCLLNFMRYYASNEPTPQKYNVFDTSNLADVDLIAIASVVTAGHLSASEHQNIKDWVEQGGSFICFNDAVGFLTEWFGISTDGQDQIQTLNFPVNNVLNLNGLLGNYDIDFYEGQGNTYTFFADVPFLTEVVRVNDNRAGIVAGSYGSGKLLFAQGGLINYRASDYLSPLLCRIVEWSLPVEYQSVRIVKTEIKETPIILELHDTAPSYVDIIHEMNEILLANNINSISYGVMPHRGASTELINEMNRMNFEFDQHGDSRGHYSINGMSYTDLMQVMSEGKQMLIDAFNMTPVLYQAVGYGVPTLEAETVFPDLDMWFSSRWNVAQSFNYRDSGLMLVPIWAMRSMDNVGYDTLMQINAYEQFRLTDRQPLGICFHPRWTSVDALQQFVEYLVNYRSGEYRFTTHVETMEACGETASGFYDGSGLPSGRYGYGKGLRSLTSFRCSMPTLNEGFDAVFQTVQDSRVKLAFNMTPVSVDLDGVPCLIVDNTVITPRLDRSQTYNLHVEFTDEQPESPPEHNPHTLIVRVKNTWSKNPLPSAPVTISNSTFSTLIFSNLTGYCSPLLLSNGSYNVLGRYEDFIDNNTVIDLQNHTYMKLYLTPEGTPQTSGSSTPILYYTALFITGVIITWRKKRK